MFRACDLVVLSKVDLLGVLDDFDPERAAAALRALGRGTPMIQTAARRVPAISAWLNWLDQQVIERRSVMPAVPTRMAATAGA
jgi:hydrogenase nickel incorporation protein HypB